MNSIMEALIVIGTIFLGVALGLLLLFWPIHYATEKGQIASFKSVQETMDRARANSKISKYEIAAIQQKAVDSNKWLAEAQYWNHTIFEWAWPDEVDDLRPIQ
jgi:hypothetical protein